MRRRWLSAAARWGLTALTAAVIVAWVMSRWWTVGFVLDSGTNIGLAAGTVACDLSRSTVAQHAEPERGFYCTRDDPGVNLGMFWLPHLVPHPWYEIIIVPLWFLALPLAAGTALAWRTPVRLALRRRRGACVKCGYARAGLAADAVCPECAAAPGG
jgi:hypothetical protein